MTLWSIASTATLVWVRLYTQGLPETAKSARRAEIESDLYEQSRSDDASSLEILRAAVQGIPDDFIWRAGQIGSQTLLLQNLALAAIAGFASGLGVYCALLFAGAGILAVPIGLLVSLLSLIALSRVSGKETPAMQTNASPRFEDAGWTAPSIAAALILPLTLGATMILAQGSHDPN
jgi:hypothetical protein